MKQRNSNKKFGFWEDLTNFIIVLDHTANRWKYQIIGRPLGNAIDIGKRVQAIIDSWTRAVGSTFCRQKSRNTAVKTRIGQVLVNQLCAFIYSQSAPLPINIHFISWDNFYFLPIRVSAETKKTANGTPLAKPRRLNGGIGFSTPDSAQDAGDSFLISELEKLVFSHFRINLISKIA